MIDEDYGALEKAMIAAQAEMKNAHMNQTNPHFRSKFADLPAVREATLPILNKHGLGIIQRTMLGEHGFVLVTRLFHETGQALEAFYPLPVNEKPQQIGSAITYARRYSWAAMCGIAADEDDDGNAAQEADTNGKAKNGRGRDWGKASQAKKNGDWQAFERDLSQCETVVAVDQLRKDYERTTYPNWNQAWRDQADEAFAKRHAELEDGVISDPTPPPNGEARTIAASKQNQGRNDRAPGDRMPFEESAAVGEMLIAAMRAARTQPDLEKWKDDNKGQIDQLVDEHFYSLKLEYGKLFKKLPESVLEAC